MQVSFSTEPIAVGEARVLRVDGQEPISLNIKCFVNKPPPPGFKPCPECGSVIIKSGEARLITVPKKAFAQGGGSLVIVVKDRTGETASFKLEVMNWGRPGTTGTQ